MRYQVTTTDGELPPVRNGARGFALMMVAALGLAAGACTAVPNWANPVEWYDGVFGRQSGKSAPPQTASKQSNQSDTSRGFSNLSDVPERPQATEPAERKAVQAGLVADRKNAKYIDDVARNRVAEAAAVSFDGGSANLDKAGQAAVRRIADRQKLAGGGVRVVGYEPAAPLASAAKALPQVALERARAVAAELVRLGVNPQLIRVEGSTTREQPGRNAEVFLEN